MKTEDHYILGVDIGGTTFTSAVFNNSLKRVDISEKGKVKDYQDGDSLLNAICNQALTLADKNHIPKKYLKSIGVSCPGPLNADDGIILDTPNLKQFSHFPVSKKLFNKTGIPTVIDNDANLFALGEWYLLSDKNVKILVSLTLGTGLGFGVILNGKVFRGAHGMGTEYGISPINGKSWEDHIAIRGLRKLSRKYLKNNFSPKQLNQLASSGDPNARIIWSEYGRILGQFLSHAINLLDPDLITIGGGISHAFPHFESTMRQEISKYSPAYNHYEIGIFESTHKEYSAMLGAASLAKTRW